MKELAQHQTQVCALSDRHRTKQASVQPLATPVAANTDLGPTVNIRSVVSPVQDPLLLTKKQDRCDVKGEESPLQQPRPCTTPFCQDTSETAASSEGGRGSPLRRRQTLAA